MLTSFHTVATVCLAWLSVFVQTAAPSLQPWVGTQPDFLPALMVHTALRTSVWNVVLLGLLGGFMLDSVSGNPVGVSCLPLGLVGWLLHGRRDFILREQTFAQFILGFGAGAAVPFLTGVLLLSLGRQPLVGWNSVVPWTVLALSSGLATPLMFRLFRQVERWFAFRKPEPGTFRPDREIRRGRQ
ncbi:MAG: rod shape-determining protein MreD [Verrucomicrobiota bacterium]|nr:rod shape-determining protein MreD [Limisphaera sp.]MDW8381000.1 rod shape-determining protein MreD [Verrucomicrobiota bacterium]